MSGVLSSLRRYAVAVLATALAALAQGALHSTLGPRYPLLAFYPAIAVSAWFGGFRPGLLSTVLGGAAAALALVGPAPPFRQVSLDEALALVMFVLNGVLLSALSEGLLRARTKAETSAQQAERELHERRRVEQERRRVEQERTELIAREQAALAEIRVETKFRVLLESAPDAIVTVDRDGRILLINSQTEKLFGYSRDELIDQPIEVLLPDQLQQLRALQFHRAYADPSTRPTGLLPDVFARRKDGSGFPAEISLSPLETDEGPLVTAVVRDITERRKIEEEQAKLIREQAARVEAEAESWRWYFLADVSALLSSSLDYGTTLQTIARLALPTLADQCVVHLQNDDGRVTQVASSHVVPAKEELLRDLATLYHVDPANPLDTIGRVIGSGASVLLPELSEPPPGAGIMPDSQLRAFFDALRPTSLICVPLTARGRTIGAMSFVMSESGRVYGTAELSLAEELARRVALAVENARLYTKAEEANRLKDEFLATLSHELRTPLNAILGWARILRSKPLDAGTGRAIDVIRRNAEAQTRLIEDILDVSRIITGKLRLQLEVVDLRSVVEAALESVRPAAEAKGIRLESSIEPTAPQVKGDPHRLQQIVWNVLSNAVKFTNKDGKVSVTVRRIEGLVEISVADTGIGIRREVLPLVFDRFKQGDSSSTRAHGGLGLGLAIVRHLVELHGGTVQATSAGEGHGATFRVRLPTQAVMAAQPAGEQLYLRGLEPAADASSLEGLRVLVVDDEADARDLLSAVLQATGANVAVAASTAEAMDALDRTQADVLVADIGMPDEDGYGLIRRVRARRPDRGGLMPAVALTAYARAEDREAALAAGFQVHIAKPVEASYLVSTIAELAGRQSSGQ